MTGRQGCSRRRAPSGAAACPWGQARWGATSAAWTRRSRQLCDVSPGLCRPRRWATPGTHTRKPDQAHCPGTLHARPSQPKAWCQRHLVHAVLHVVPKAFLARHRGSVQASCGAPSFISSCLLLHADSRCCFHQARDRQSRFRKRPGYRVSQQGFGCRVTLTS